MSISRAGEGDVFEWLDRVRARPGMYIPEDEQALHELENLLHGYYSSLAVHGIVEPVPAMSYHFSTWLGLETGWSMSVGFAAAFTDRSRRRDRLAHFFHFVDRYRKLEPAVRLSVSRRTSTKTPELPSRIDVVQYAPTRLYFLRQWHRTKTRDGRVWIGAESDHDPTLAVAKRAIVDKFPQYAAPIARLANPRQSPTRQGEFGDE